MSAPLVPQNWTWEEFAKREAEIVAAGQAMRGPSLAEEFAAMPEAEREAFLDELRPVEWLRLQYDWRFWGRPKQLLALDPGDWDVALFLAGRGFGKSRTGAETMWDRIHRGLARSLCFVAPDWKDVRRNMVGGLPDTDSGFLDILPSWLPRDSEEGVIYNESKQEIYLPAFGATIYLNTGEKPEQRGGNFDLVWIDEPIKFRYLERVMMNLDMATRRRSRIGGRPQRIITTTPMKQMWLCNLIMSPRVLAVHGDSDENDSNNDPDFVAKMIAKYGPRIAMQEIHARILGDNEGAIASSTKIDQDRIEEAPEHLDEVGVGVDPAVSTKRKSDDTGIVAGGREGRKGSTDARLYVLEDRSGRYSPDGWATAAVDVACDWGAKWIAVETNKIGETGKALLMHALDRRKMIDKIEIREAYSFRDKGTRAKSSLQPLYDRRRVHHVGRFPQLESQLSQWNPDTDPVSPNNLDAEVHMAIELMGLAVTEKEIDTSKRWRGLARANEGFEVSGRDRV